jgi:hypothetical protein
MALSNIVETIVKLRGSREFQHEARDTAKSVLGIGDSTEKAGKKATAGWKGVAKWASGTAAIAGVGAFMKTAVGAAVDLNEEVNKSAVVFGKASPRLLDFSKNAATALGMSQEQALAAAGTFGNMLVPMGFARDRSAEMSTQLVKLAADMASFNNASPEDTLLALRSGLAGESEPLRKYGVFLNDARLKQEAMNLGLKNAVGKNGALTAAAKAQATYAVILQDTKDAQGDFVRTSGSLANQQRILKAQWTQQAAVIGTQLLPVALQLAQVLGFMLKHSAALYVGIGLLTAAFVALKIAETVATIQAIEFNFALLLIPLAVIAIVAGIVALYMKWKWFHNAVNDTFAWIKKNWPLLVAILGGPIALAVLAIVKNFDKIKAGFVGVLNWMIDKLNAVLGFVNKAVGVFNKLPGPDIGKVGTIGHMAAGGPVQRTGPYLVGERGPELVSLQRGAHVFPNSAIAGGLPPLDSIGSGGTVVTKVYLDKRQIAEAVGKYTSDTKARR